ncbi:hypothetical protein SynMVIR181_00936 [Synechococcus sp. MVIR-18-1]|nr:hypothetical protein SynMVIR181_00936 [Synechococcus sp. MVIR-18-1]
MVRQQDSLIDAGTISVARDWKAAKSVCLQDLVDHGSRLGLGYSLRQHKAKPKSHTILLRLLVMRLP